MANEYLIQKATLETVANTIRGCLNRTGYSIYSDIISKDKIFMLKENRVQVAYIEYIDYDGQYADGKIPGNDSPHADKKIIAYSYAFNNNNELVPILYWTETQDPDTAEPLYYCGLESINDIQYAKWRKIDNDGFSWSDTAQQYVYTNRIVNVEVEEKLAPQDFSQAILTIDSAARTAYAYENANEEVY